MAKPDHADELSALFTALLEAFRKKLADGEVDAATLGQIRQFLRDNNISSTPSANNRGLLRLAEALPFGTSDGDN